MHHSNPMERVLATLQQHGCDPRQSGQYWVACCPAHDDRRPSFVLSEGHGGKATIRCMAGCSGDAVLRALGLTWRDLYPDNDSPRGNSQPRSGTAAGVGGAQGDGGRGSDSAWATAAAAIEALSRKRGKPSGRWDYHNAEGNLAGVVLRWDGPNGKDIRPLARHPNGWRIGAMPDPRPLYGLPDLASARRVIVCEGEKAADAARSLGFTATTSAGGSQAAAKTDWRPLAGKEVWILPDNDAPGRKYAETVAGILAKLTPAAVVRVIELPDLPDGGDIADWIDAHGDATEPDTMRAEIEVLAQAAELWRSTEQPGPADDLSWRPFPVDALPEPIRGFVDAGARAIGCDPSYLALPLLTAIAAAIGNTRRLELKRGWLAPPILWGAIVGESGTAKTPAFRLVMRPVRERQSRAFKVFDAQQQEYEAALEAWQEAKKGERGEKPQPPSCQRFIVSDTTVEALAPILLENPRGLLLARDELAGWIGSFDRYAAGKGRAGVDSANWLSMFNAESIIVDRKTGDPRTIHVPQAAVCVSGGIQPAILQRALGPEHRESGLAARLLLACPPRRPKRWTEADIDPGMEAELVRLFDRLYELQPMAGDDGEPRPRLVRLSDDAKSAWREYYNEHNQEQVALDGDMAAAWSKLEEYAARLALVVHYVRWAAGDVADETRLDVASMNAGIVLAKWFKHEARRVYAMLDESDAERDQRRLLEWIESRGGSVTPREVQMGCRWLREPGAAEAALEELAKAGLGGWQDLSPTAKRGRPARAFALRQHVNMSTKPPGGQSPCQRNPENPRENRGFVDVDTVDTVDAPDTDPAEADWGSV